MPDEKTILRFNSWLRNNRLTQDPFASSEAGQEPAYLSSVFVDRPYFREILGDPKYPRPAFLLAGRGEGKTATGMMVAYECHHANKDRKALPVRYFDFYYLLEQAGDPGKITLRHHVRLLSRAILKTIAKDVPVPTFDRLNEADRGLLAGYAREFADPATRRDLLRLLPGEAAGLDWDSFTPLETLQMLAELVTRFTPPDGNPYQATYILVDRVDESTAGPEAAMDILRPLIKEVPVLETPHLGFKFFLPAEVGEALRQTLPIREDRVVIRKITWDYHALESMIETRLRHFSEPYEYNTSLADLCKDNARYKVMGKLIGACENSPRTLLQLCSMLLHRHIIDSTGLEPGIDLQTVINTIKDFEREKEAARVRKMELTAAARIDTEQPQTPPESGLYLDGADQVWIDGKQLDPPLTKHEFALLRMLYIQSPGTLSQETLIECIWPEGPFGRDEQNLRKLIGRLRERMAKSPSDDRGRFIQNVRGRGYKLVRN